MSVLQSVLLSRGMPFSEIFQQTIVLVPQQNEPWNRILGGTQSFVLLPFTTILRMNAFNVGLLEVDRFACPIKL